jgi:hypothetical protein
MYNHARVAIRRKSNLHDVLAPFVEHRVRHQGRLRSRVAQHVWRHSVMTLIAEATAAAALPYRPLRIGKIPVSASNVQSTAAPTIGPFLRTLPPALRRKLTGRLLDDGAEREQRFFIERSPNQLETERQTLGIEGTGDRNAGKSGHVHRHRENVV